MALGLIKKLVPNQIKQRIKSIKKKKDFEQFKKEAEVLTKSDLIKGFISAGIEKGDSLFIHSSLKGLGYIENGAIDIINALQEVVGEEGTLVFPTYSISLSMFDTVNDPDFVFDPDSSPSTVGRITNVFREMPGVVRSLHPTHSIAAWGKNAKYLTEDHYKAKSNFSVDSPFGKFLKLNGKIVGLGINYGNVTFYHTYEDHNLEKFNGVYLPNKYKAKMKNGDDVIETEIYIHNPEFHKTRIEKDPKVEAFFANYFQTNNVSRTTPIGQGEMWWINAEDMMRHLGLLYDQGKTIYKV